MSELQTITLGGGCFWCTEAVFVKVRGVTDVESGYCNGHVVKPSYEQVCSGDGIDDYDVTDLLMSLVDKSMVATDSARDGTTRYILLETLRNEFGVAPDQDYVTHEVTYRRRQWRKIGPFPLAACNQHKLATG